MNFITRKPIRLSEFDYSTNGVYFITVCTKDRQCILWNTNSVEAESTAYPVGADIIRPNSKVAFNEKASSQKEILITPVGAEIIRPNSRLSEYGEIVYNAILNIKKHYDYVTVEKFVIMPNHIHLLLMIDSGGRILSAPTKTISTIIGQLKRSVSKSIGNSIWQKSFYDHIIRDENDFFTKWKYIDENPIKWETDEYF